MKGVKRLFIDKDWDKMKELYPELTDSQIQCMKIKWNPFKDWEQGFDSDCFGHCSSYELCRKAFYDERADLENHFKEIVIPCEEKLFWGDEEVSIEDVEETE